MKPRRIPTAEEPLKGIIINEGEPVVSGPELLVKMESLAQQFAKIDEKRLPVVWTYDQKFSAVMIEIERRMDEIDKKLDALCRALLITPPPIEVEYEKAEEVSI